MMTDRMKKYGCILLSALMLLLMLPLQVLAAGVIELDRDVALTISYKDGSTALSGAEFSIYRVADVDAYAYSEFTLTEEFTASNVSVNNLDSSEWRDAANTLAGYVQLNGIEALDSGSTDTDGMLTFPSDKSIIIKPGLYLVIGQKHTQNNTVYTAEPFLVSLPALNEIENDWDYIGTASPKYAEKPIVPIIPDIPEPDVDRKVIKVWDDEGYEHNRPDHVIAVLLRDGVPYDSVVLDEDNDWTHRWTGLDADYTWTVTEKEVPDGYTVSIRKEGITYVITNTYHPDVETDEIKVIKVWDDNGSTGMRPSSVVVELLAGNKVFDTVILNELNNWQYRWTGLDISGRWSVREKYVPDGYTDSVTRNGDTFIITNTLNATEETVSRQVIKIWEDKGYEENRPDEITVELLADGQVCDTVVLNADNNWIYQWNGLNKDIEWSIHEVIVPENYTSVITAEGVVFIVTNTYTPPYTPPELVDRTVLKVWKNDGAHLDERPAEVQAALLCNGEVYEVVALNEENGWTYSWTGLDGEMEWTIVEYTVLDKYTSSVTQDGNTFIITNTYSDIPQTGQLWWPVPMLLALGLGMIVAGLIRRRGAEYEE